MTEHQLADSAQPELKKAILSIQATPAVRARTGIGRETVTAARTLGEAIEALGEIYPGFKAAVSSLASPLDDRFRFYTVAGTRLRDLDTPLGDVTVLRLDYF